jgi:hypothetical protein
MNEVRVASCCVLLITLTFLFGATAAGQIPFGSREYADIKRKRPAEVHLTNLTFQIQVTTLDTRAAHLVERFKKQVANGVLASNRTLREVPTSPQVIVECAITNYDFSEKTEERKKMVLKDAGTFKIITLNLGVSYKVIRRADNYTYFADNYSTIYKKEFQVGVQTAPNKAEVEDVTMANVVSAVLVKLTNTEEKLKVRLMGKDELGRYARLAQSGQWLPYTESVIAIPQKKIDKEGLSDFEGDRNYDLAIAYEALAYEAMWTDYDSAGKYFELAEKYVRDAQKFDPREKEYVNAQARINDGKAYFKTVKERFPKQAATPSVSAGSRAIDEKPKEKDGALTNDSIIEMAKAGFSESFILDEIKRAKEPQFDTATSALIRLRSEGVSEAVIREIIRRASGSKRK